MEKDEQYNKLLSTLQATKPSLSSKEFDVMAENIMKGVENKRQKQHPVIIAIISICSAAAILLVVLLCAELFQINERQGVTENPYFVTVYKKNDAVKISSLQSLLGYYTQKNSDKQEISAIVEKYINKEKNNIATQNSAQ